MPAVLSGARVSNASKLFPATARLRLRRDPSLALVTAALLVILPAIIFYVILFRHLVNVPIADDYYALFDFLNRLREAPTLTGKAYYFLISQHNEYKLFFEHGLFWAQVECLGRINLTVLCILGDSFAIWLAIVLWKMFAPGYPDNTGRLTLFIPIAWLVFQLQYAQTLNFAMGALQNLPVVVFSLWTILLLFQMKRSTFWAALATLILAVSSSGNGLFMIPIGCAILLSRRKYGNLCVWLAISSICIAAYFYRYDPKLWLTPFHSAIPPLSQFWRPWYLICFLGSAAAYPIKAASAIFGISICAFFVYMAWQGYFRRRPEIGYSLCFILATAVAVAGFRSNLGLIYSTSSRYTIYSILLLIFAWFAIADEYLIQGNRPCWRVFGAIVAACAVLFSIAMDAWGLRYLERRNRDLIIGMRLYEHNFTERSAAGPIFPPPKSKPEQEFNLRVRDILRDSVRLGIYKLPDY
ncbi:MAG: hypothetical protein JO138_26520 [Acidobacteriaceae bacterium]|nr:hypothetical protein [Acidobacteriaceae bacterium]